MYVRMFDLRSKSFKNAASVEPMQNYYVKCSLDCQVVATLPVKVFAQKLIVKRRPLARKSHSASLTLLFISL